MSKTYRIIVEEPTTIEDYAAAEFPYLEHDAYNRIMDDHRRIYLLGAAKQRELDEQRLKQR